MMTIYGGKAASDVGRILYVALMKGNSVKALTDTDSVNSLSHNPDFNPLPHMPILRSSNLAAIKDMMSKKWTNGDTII